MLAEVETLLVRELRRVLMALLVGLAGGCKAPPPVMVTEHELVGTYTARTKELDRVRTGRVRLEAGGTYVHQFEAGGEAREEVGAWTVVQSPNGTQVRLTRFTADWVDLRPTMFQTPIIRHGSGLALVADSDAGFYFVRDGARR